MTHMSSGEKAFHTSSPEGKIFSQLIPFQKALRPKVSLTYPSRLKWNTGHQNLKMHLGCNPPGTLNINMKTLNFGLPGS